MVMSSQKRNKIQIIIKPQRNDREDYKMTAININKNNFQNEVMNSDKTVLLDFGRLGVLLVVWWFLS